MEQPAGHGRWPEALAASPAVVIVDQLMNVEIDDCRLWRLAKLEARVVVPLDFGTY